MKFDGWRPMSFLRHLYPWRQRPSMGSRSYVYFEGSHVGMNFAQSQGPIREPPANASCGLSSLDR